MKKKICVLIIVLSICNLSLRIDSHAAEVDFQPRLETGSMFYAMEFSALSKSVLPGPGEPSGYSFGQGKIELCDNVGFVGGGVTFFIDRFFVDLSGQRTFDGSDRSQVSISEYREGTMNTFTSTEVEYSGRFHRVDQAVSVGCSVTRKFSVFGGYKWAGVDLDARFDGPASLLNIDNWAANGRYSGQEHMQFKYEGPFIGVMHGSQIDGPGFFHGLISVKLGVAYLKSKLNRWETSTLMCDRLNGQEIEPVMDTVVTNIEIKGDTVGLKLGIDWRGATPIKNLSYYLGASGYRYNFNSNAPDSSDITETAVTFKIALGYIL